MKMVVIGALAMINAGLVAETGRLMIDAPPSIESEPAIPAPRATAAPLRAVSVIDRAPDLTVGQTMFGTRVTSSMQVERPMRAPQPREPETTLRVRGILQFQNGRGTQATIVLLQHGSPPDVGRYAIGDVVEGWRFDSATRTSVTFSKTDGSAMSLHLDPKTSDIDERKPLMQP